MDIFAFPPLAALLDGALHGLLRLAEALHPLAGSAATAAAVVLVTLLVRALLIPVGVSQARAEQTRARLAPRIRALQERYGTDRERLQRETMKLYADEKASPFAGCLPVLLQAPVVGVLYAVFLHAQIAGHANALLQATLWGVPLGTSLSTAVATAADPVTLLVLGAVVLSIAAVGELTRRALRPAALPGGGGVATGRALGLLQFATAVFAVFVPLAASLYLFVTVAWTLVQRILLRRRYPLPQ